MKNIRSKLLFLTLSFALFAALGVNANGDDEDDDESDQDTVQSTDSDTSVCTPGLEIVLSSPTEGQIEGSLNISVVICSGASPTASIDVEI